MTPRQDLAWMLWWLACESARYGQDKAQRIGEVAAEIQLQEADMVYDDELTYDECRAFEKYERWGVPLDLSTLCDFERIADKFYIDSAIRDQAKEIVEEHYEAMQQEKEQRY